MNAIHHDARAHQTVSGSPYCLPADEAESQRLVRQHYALKTNIGEGKLLQADFNLAPEAEILDSGTGTAIWALDLAKEVASTTKIYGTDIETRLFKTDIPENVTLSEGSITNLPEEWTGKFDLIHQRLLLYALRRADWTKAISEMYRSTKAGGSIQLTEVITPPNSEAGPYNRRWYQLLEAFMGSNGTLLHCARILPELMNEAGFVGVTCKEKRIVLGSKGGQAGMDARKSRIGAFRGMRTPILHAGGFGFVSSAEEFDELLEGVEREWEESGLAQAGYVHIIAHHPHLPTPPISPKLRARPAPVTAPLASARIEASIMSPITPRVQQFVAESLLGEKPRLDGGLRKPVKPIIADSSLFNLREWGILPVAAGVGAVFGTLHLLGSVFLPH